MARIYLDFDGVINAANIMRTEDSRGDSRSLDVWGDYVTQRVPGIGPVTYSPSVVQFLQNLTEQGVAGFWCTSLGPAVSALALLGFPALPHLKIDVRRADMRWPKLHAVSEHLQRAPDSQSVVWVDDEANQRPEVARWAELKGVSLISPNPVHGISPDDLHRIAVGLNLSGQNPRDPLA